MRPPTDTAPQHGKPGIREQLTAAHDTFRGPADVDQRVDETDAPGSIAPEPGYGMSNEDDAPSVAEVVSPRSFFRKKRLMAASTVVLIGTTVLGLQFGALQRLALAAGGRVEPPGTSSPPQQLSLAEAGADRQSLADRAGAAAPGSKPAVASRENVAPALPLPGAETARSAEAASRGQQASALPQDIAAARLELFGQALDEERARSAGLKSELAAAQRDRELQAEQIRQISEEIRQLRRAAADTAPTLDQTRGQTTIQAPEIAAARDELTANVRKFRQALDEERARTAAVSAELAAARRDNEAEAAARRRSAEEVAQTTGRTIAELRQSLQQQRERADTLARDLESRQRTATISTAPAAKQDGARPARATEAAATAQPPAAEAPGDPEARRLIARARALLGQGNIGAARIVLERASDTGSARASFTLAETYDPAVLSTWGTYGTRGDAAKARELYAKAQAGGIQEARNRLERLNH